MNDSQQSESTGRSISGGPVLILLAAMLWGTTGTSQALAPAGVNSLAIGALRLLVGAFSLLGLALFRGGFKERHHWPLLLTFIAGASTAFYQITFFNGVRLAGVAVGTTITIGSSPIFTGLLEYLFRRERLTLQWVVATLLSVTGLILLMTANQEGIEADLWGTLLALGAGLSYAIFASANKALVREHRPDEVMAVSFSLGAILLLPLLFFTPLAWLGSVRGIGVVLYLGMIATGLSYALFGRGLQTTSAPTATTLSLIEPLTAALLGIFILGEALTAGAVIGMVLIAVGLALLTVSVSRKQT